jgi:hypothetical protein
MKKSGIILFAMLVFMCCLPVPVHAAEVSMEVDLSQDYTNCVFQIRWENQDHSASVTVVSPAGKAFGEKETPDSVTVQPGNVLIRVGAAKTGKWTVRVNGEDLGRLTVDGGQFPGNMNIDQFTVVRTGNEAKASWKISDCPNDLQFAIYADTDRTGYDGEQVASFSGGPAGDRTFDLSGLSSGSYFFYLRVSHESGAFSQAYAQQALEYQNPSAPAKLSNVKAGMVDDSLFLTWDAVKADRYRVRLYDGKDGGLLQTNDVDGKTSYSWAPDSGTESVFAEVAALEGDTPGQFDRALVELKNPLKAEVKFPAGNVCNQRTVTADVTFTENCTVRASLNGTPCLTDASKQGPYRVTMEDGQNTIVFLVQDDQNHARTFTKELYVDTTPPQLSIRSDVNGTKTSDAQIYLTGYTEQGASLTLNKKAVETKNGYFSLPCSLSPGQNTIVLSAKDAAGNESVYRAVVTRSIAGTSLLLRIIGGALILVLGVLYTVIFVRGVRRNRRENH